ncbi:hypothetical protein H7K32_15185 [Brevibacillus agri]|uniref:hypothetical protein n=1 Tax=Brevibacillus agri TaxID=51101 RepID=UPI001C8EC103|nr:hypothetical protein [Brevibacillus agri]MBY0052993.1 hypothetical protein [Brevibacillus agri]MDR9504780.1 hypothetical protein [Brevibacillus agri]
MVKVKFQKLSDTKAIVTVIEYQHDGKTDANSVLVDSIPDPAPDETKIPRLYINPQTKDFSYEYEDMILPPEQQRIIDLEGKVKVLSDTIDYLLGV